MWECFWCACDTVAEGVQPNRHNRQAADLVDIRFSGRSPSERKCESLRADGRELESLTLKPHDICYATLLLVAGVLFDTDNKYK